MVARKPKSPIDDVAKWLTREIGRSLSKSEVLKVKKFARGIGYNKEYEKSIAPKIATGTKMGKVVPKVKSHLDRMSEKRQDKEARVFGDYKSPHDYFDIGNRGGTVQKDLNKKFNDAWQKEMAIGKANAKKTSARTNVGNYRSPKPTAKQVAARKAASAKAAAKRNNNKKK